MGNITILPETTKDPISLMGRRAGVCWGGNVEDADKNYKRGLDCIKSNHGRVLEFVNIEMVIDGYSARVIREWYTHIGGAPTRLQASTRYIKYDNFDYVVPPKIKADPIQHGRFLYTMGEIQKMLAHMEDDGVPREDLATMLPLSMTTKVVDKRNLRNLIDMSRQRMCNRAYWEFRELFKDICDALKAYSDEWKYIIETQMMPKCEYLGYCPEAKGCGRKPKQDDKTLIVTKLEKPITDIDWANFDPITPLPPIEMLYGENWVQSKPLSYPDTLDDITRGWHE